jgi:hypothetical protein
MRWCCQIALLVLLCIGDDVCTQAPPLLDYPTLLRRLVDVDWLWQPPMAGERCVQFSSYDRRSEAGPGDAERYANNDRGNYLRVAEQDGQKEFVLADASGPGCIARIWSANPSGTLHFDIDGERVWSVDFAALCSGKVEGVPEPIAGMRSKGGNCCLPIPFGQRLVVSCTAGDLYYLVDVVQWPASTEVVRFEPGMLAAHAADIQMTAKWLLVGELPVAAFENERPVTKLTVPRDTLVRKLALQVQRPGQAPIGRAMQSRRLVVQCGGETTVDVPLTSFFASGPDWLPWESGRLAVHSTGHAASFWPMPMPEGGIIEIVGGDADGGALVGLAVLATPMVAGGPAPLLFHASYHLAKATPTRPFTDHLVLDATGTGRFVGCSLLVRNPSRIWWGEGDEKVSVDREAFPSWWGTGTEDYFGYGWCDPTPFQAPFHAQIECQGPQNFGFTQLHRTHVLDNIPFQKSLRFEFERWHWVETAKMDYATVAYWYGAPGAKSGLPPVPPADERWLPRLERPPMWLADGVLEAEDLRVLSCSGGSHQRQDMGQFERQFSQDGMQWWWDGKLGDALVLVLPVPAAGRYRVSAAFGQADNSGRVQLSIGGTRVGTPFDGYSARTQASGPILLGEVTLAAGDHELRLELDGSNERAQPGHQVGLDYLRLEPLP